MRALMPLAGLRVGILQTRYAREFAALIEREGGIPVMAPCLREVRTEDPGPLLSALQRLVDSPVEVFIFQTGVGASALMDLASDLGLADRLAEQIRSATVLTRGPKPLTALLNRGFRVDRRTVEPHTTAELLELLDLEELQGRRVALQHYGSINERLVAYLRRRGACVIELVSYTWALPQEVEPILHFLQQLAAGHIAVTTFTSASQVENLFTVAREAGHGCRLERWLNDLTVTAAIGPTCAGALVGSGVQVRIKPERPKMVPFVRAISEYFLERRAPGARPLA